MDEAFGAWLRRQRKEKKLSVREVAKRADLTPGYISLMENGKRKPKAGTLAPLSQALGMAYGEVLQAAGYLDDQHMMFAHRLRTTRLARQMSSSDLAQLCHLSPRTIEQWEFGSSRLPGRQALGRLADALQVVPDYLVGATDRQPMDLDVLLNQENVSYHGVPLTEDQRTFVRDFIQRALQLSSGPSSEGSAPEDAD